MNVGIVGSRRVADYYYSDFKSFLIPILANLGKIDCIVSGGAIGIDSFTESYAKENGLSILIHYPDWKKYGRSAGIKRNDKIIGSSDIIIAFWDNVSKGTYYTIQQAEKSGKKVYLPPMIF